MKKIEKRTDADAQNQPAADTTYRVENFKRAQIEKSTHKSFLSVGVYLQADAAYFEFPGTLPFIGVYFIIQRAQLERDEFMRYLACSIAVAPRALFPQRNWRVVCPECIRTPSSLSLSLSRPCVCVRRCVMLAGK